MAAAPTLLQAEPSMKDSPPRKVRLVPPLARGTVLRERYKILAPIGEGAMGVVYEAFDETLKRKVAIKTLLEISDDNLRRFEAEGVFAAQIRNRYVIQVFDAWMAASGEPFLLMERLHGKTLQNLVKDEMRAGLQLDPSRAVTLLLGACQGITEAHACGIVHRDLSAGNVFVVDGREEIAKVLDFGVSTSVDLSGKTSPHAVI